jgi:ATP-binding cassette, subfamily B, bacterial
MLWFAALASIWFAGPLLNRLYTVIGAFVLTGLRARIQEHAFAYVIDHAPTYFLDTMPGTVAQKIRQAANATIAILEVFVLVVPRIVILLSIGAVLLWRAAPDLLPIFAIFSLVFGVVSWQMALRCRDFAKAHAKSSAALGGRLVDALGNWNLVRIFARDVHERWTLSGYISEEWLNSRNLRFALALMRIVLHTVASFFLIVIIWLAVVDCLDGQLGVGDLAMVVTLSLLIAGSVNYLGDNLLFFFEHLGTLSDALDTTTVPHAIVDVPGAPPLKVTEGRVTLDRITFAFPDGKGVFRDLSLEIKPGEKVALVGPSGAGKSTLTKLIRRHFLPESGRVLIDGQDITQVQWSSIHDQVTEVPQDAGVFHRSIGDNIRYGRPDATDDEVAAAAKAAHCHDFIVARKHGYDSVVGERGMKLSGGERQRIAIARAFLKDAPILILDEATSSLDSEIEHLIQDALTRLVTGRTVLAIAHRLSTIMHMDRIVFLENGAIIEEGTHAELLAKGGAYAKHWQRQAGGFV